MKRLLQPSTRDADRLLRAHQIHEGQRDLGTCSGCALSVSLHFEKHGNVRRMVGCDGAAIAARIVRRRQAHTSPDGASA